MMRVVARQALAGAALATMVASLASVGCAREAGVERVVDGRLLVGRFIDPEAYAAFLRGALEEERGNLAEALRAYGAALEDDAADPEIWSRIARVRCALKPGDASADEAMRRAFALDGKYAGAFAARAECELLRGNAEAAREAAAQAAAQDPSAVDVQLLLVRASTSRDDPSTRARLLALTLAHATSVAAWDALATWSRDHGDVALFARALSALAPLDARRAGAIAAASEALAGQGEPVAARDVARALSDAAAKRGFGGLTSDAHPLAARLAVDDAIERGDESVVRLRATRTHLGLARTAARALLRGKDALARAIAAPLVEADPSSIAAKMTLAALTGDDAAALARARLDAPRATVPVECALAFARALAPRVSSAEAARAYGSVDREPMVLGDALALPIAVDLAAQGIVPADELPLDGAIELAARRGESPPPPALTGSALHPPPVDARHELLALAIAAPSSPRARELASRLARLRDRDPIVAVGIARLELASPGAADASLSAAALLGRDPSDPLLAAAAVDVAKKRGDAAALARARAVLSAIARTGAERARLTE